MRDLITNLLVIDTQVSASSATVTLQEGRPYRWNVAACNSAGCSAFTTARYFQTPPSLPAIPPIPTNPTPGSTSSPGPILSSSTVALDWSSSSGATFYDLGVRDLITNLLVIDQTVSNSSFTATLEEDKPYRWNVAACNSSGCSSFTTPRYFQTPAPQGTPDIDISPLSLTFDSPMVLSNDLFAVDLKPEPGKDSDSSVVLSTEVAIDFSSDVQFSSLSGFSVGPWGLRLVDDTREGTAESLPLAAPTAFASLGIKWTSSSNDAADIELLIRTSRDGHDWASWTAATTDGHLTVPHSALFFGNLVTVPKGTAFIQYAINLKRPEEKAPAALTSLTFIFINPGETPLPILEQLLAPNPPVFSRTQWGCPDGEDSPLWPPSPTTVSHLILHHTETTNSATDWPAQVRSIWSYHTFTRGWGDIGYNYLIDPLGVIYQGRAGGENILGAHFSCQNEATQGVALLGSYTSTTPTEAALRSLEALLAWIASREEVDPLGVSFHGGAQLSLNNISGHRDGNSSQHVCSTTACPGDSLYPFLPTIRDNVATLVDGGNSQFFTIRNDGNADLAVTSMQLQSSGPWISWSPPAPFVLANGESQQVTVSVDFSAAPPGHSTRRILVLSDDPDESPFPEAVNIVVNAAAPPTCYVLTRTHTGSGNDPAASPTNSVGCPNDQFIEGTSILMTADPAPGWNVDGWTGTINDNSTDETNTVIMPPSNHTVEAHYAEPPPPCFTLTRTHTGAGNDPAALPTNSIGCPNDQFIEGTSILMTADPAPGWNVDGWTGTINDNSTDETNTVIMPPSNHTVAAHYTEEQASCFDLTLSHTGSGLDPIAWPTNSGGCPIGAFTMGSLIQLIATPDTGWSVASWEGTENDSSTNTTNTVSMPGTNHVASAHYQEIGPSEDIFYDGFESGDPDAWSSVVP